MKKMILMVAVMAMSLAAKAWEVGDFYPNDPTGVPAVVVYVDESGEHGLIMSPRAFVDKNFDKVLASIAKGKKSMDKWNKKLKKTSVKGGANPAEIDANLAMSERTYEAVMEYLPNAPKLFDGKLKEKEEREMIEKIAAENTEYGEDNMKAVIAYCNANDVDMTKYFRNFDWAMQLGEGWFIPGNHELELFNSAFSEGVGKHYKMDYKEDIKKCEMYQYKVGVLYGMWGAWVFPYYNILSSTALKSAWEETKENKEKTGVLKKQGGSAWELADKDNYYALAKGIDFKYYYVFAKNWQQESVVVAFKRF